MKRFYNLYGETGLKIERKIGSAGTYSEIASVSADETSYSDTELSEGIFYFYRVKAFHSSGVSRYSNEASSTTFFSGGGSDHGCFIATAIYGS